VNVASTGQEALEQLTAAPAPSLVLLDLMMPIMDGWQFCALWRTHPRFADIPVIVMSATPSALPDGITGSIRKPFELDTMLRTLEAALGSPH
jgi:CheY-like chemotaxis protein